MKAGSRHPRPRTWRVWSSKRKGKKLSNTDSRQGLEERPRGQDRQDEGRHDAPGLQDPSTRWIWTPGGGGVELHPADEGDTSTLSKTLAKAEANVRARWMRHRRRRTRRMRRVSTRLSLTGGLEGSERQSLEDFRIAAPMPTGFSRWHGGRGGAMRAWSPTTVRSAQVRSWSPARPSSCAPRSSSAALPTTSIVAHATNSWLRGRENVHKRYLLHVAGHNPSLLMRQLIGAGTPREAVAERIWRY